MKTFKIGVKEIYEQMYEVKAENAEEAIDLIKNGKGEIQKDQLAYVNTMDTDTWNVFIENGEVY